MSNVVIVLILLAISQASIYQPYYQQARKIAQAMTLSQKIGQTIQADFTALNNNQRTDQSIAKTLFLGSLLVGGDGTPNDNGDLINLPSDQDGIRRVYSQSKMSKWQKLSNKFNYTITITTKDGSTYDIRPLLGTDAVHGNQHVSATILFPHNSGLACSHNAQNFYNAGYWTSIGVKQSGFNYAFAPTVAVSHNPQWGRFYETMGQEQEYIYQYAKRYTQGLQGKVGQLNGIIGSAKHFYGDGSTLFGADEGNSIVGSFKSYVKHNTQGYIGSIQSQVGSVMISYSAINFILNSVSPSINNILREKLKFDGFTISDYDQIRLVMNQKLPSNFGIMDSPAKAVTTLVNAGIDMLMIPGWRSISAVNDAINGYTESIKYGNITEDRLNDAVARILSVKLAMGAANKLKSQPLQANQGQKSRSHSSSEYEDSVQAVHQSLVLLKNNGVLPVKVNQLKYIVLVGERMISINNQNRKELFRSFDNIGMQNGGWSLRWQGFQGNSQWSAENKQATKATSILDALRNLNTQINLLYPQYSSFTEQNSINDVRNNYLRQLESTRKDMNAGNTLILSVIGETTFAEYKGDVGIPYCQQQEFNGYGCAYNSIPHPYLPTKQRSTLKVEFQSFDSQVISAIKQQDSNIPLLTIILAGRPLLIENVLNQSSAVLDAWLPGTSGGQGIVDAIAGKYVLRADGSGDRRNTLAFDWPKDEQQLKLFPVYSADGETPRLQNRLFSVGYGLSTSSNLISQ